MLFKDLAMGQKFTQSDIEDCVFQRVEPESPIESGGGCLLVEGRWINRSGKIIMSEGEIGICCDTEEVIPYPEK